MQFTYLPWAPKEALKSWPWKGKKIAAYFNGLKEKIRAAE